MQMFRNFSKAFYQSVKMSHRISSDFEDQNHPLTCSKVTIATLEQSVKYVQS